MSRPIAIDGGHDHRDEIDPILHAMQAALRDLEQYARIEQVIPTKELLRAAIAGYRPAPLAALVSPQRTLGLDGFKVYSRPKPAEPMHILDEA